MGLPFSDALASRLRRLEAAVQEVETSIDRADLDRCPDAVAIALDTLYDLWEAWKKTAKLTKAVQDSIVTGDPAGETTAALTFARGGKTHDLIEFGAFTDTFSDTFYSHYGVWRWQAYSDERPEYARRVEWYATRVCGEEVLPPFRRALACLRERPEFQT